MNEEKIQFRAGNKVIIMKGKLVKNLFLALLPKLNGNYTISDILADLKMYNRKTILITLIGMKRKGLLEDASKGTLRKFSSNELKRYDYQTTFFSCNSTLYLLL